MNIWGLLEVVIEGFVKFIARIQGFWCERCNNYNVEAKLIDVMCVPLPGGIRTTNVFEVECPKCGEKHKAFVSKHDCTNMI